MRDTIARYRDRLRPVVALVLSVAIPATPPLRADEPAVAAAPSSGTRVRFETTGEGRRTGTVVDLDGEALVVRLTRTSAVVRVPLADLGSLEVSAGRRSRAGEGAIIAAVPGALFGGYVGLYAGCYEQSNCYGSGMAYAALGAFIAGALSGLVGAAIGALFKTERWERVRVATPHASFQLGPTGQGGLAVGLTLSF